MFDLSSIELDNHIYRPKIESLGCVINNKNRLHFERILKMTCLSGTYDITDWTHEAIKVILEVCAYTNQRVTLKHGTRYFMPIKYPNSPMLETFVDAIMSNSL